MPWQTVTAIVRCISHSGGKPGDISDFLVAYDVPFNFSDNVSFSTEQIQKNFSKFVSTLMVTDEVLTNFERFRRWKCW
jgi:hypothetical protein